MIIRDLISYVGDQTMDISMELLDQNIQEIIV